MGLAGYAGTCNTSFIALRVLVRDIIPNTTYVRPSAGADVSPRPSARGTAFVCELTSETSPVTDQV